MSAEMVLRCSGCGERIEPQDVQCSECSEGILQEQKDEQRQALEAVLLFYSQPPWDTVKRERWLEITGTDEATTKVLCDHIRKILDEESGR